MRAKIYSMRDIRKASKNPLDLKSNSFGDVRPYTNAFVNRKKFKKIKINWL